MKKIGVFVCHCGINIAATVDSAKVAEAVKDIPGVEVSTDYIYMCSDPGQNLIKEMITDKGLDGVVVAACSPTLHESTFRAAAMEAGLNPYLVEMANIREQCSWVHTDKEAATRKAIRIVRNMIEKVRYNESLEPIGVPVTKRALVVGGGVAGIQAALDIANSGHEVVLVEREPSIGGHMIQLSETFPTLDCSQCILTPKMVDVARHPKIELMTYSEIDELSGFVGNFNVKIRKKSPMVDWVKCNGCGDCEAVCPVLVKNKFDIGLSERKAIYRPFPQAVPNRFTIDKRGESPCKFTCPAGVKAHGYVRLVSQGKFEEALELEREDNPFASVCGRACTHPCETSCKRGEFDEPVAIKDIKRFLADYEKEPKKPELPKQKKDKVAIIGSGPSGLSCAYQLARMGYPTEVFESLPVEGGMLVAGVPPFRLPREALKRDIDYIKNWGVKIKTNSLIKDPEKLLKDGFKAVYIATGAWKERKLGIEGEDLKGVYYGIDFLSKVNLGEKVEIGDKVSVIGGGNSAIDAARTALRMGAKEVTIVYRRSRKEMPAIEEEIDEAEHEGIKIHYLATPVKFIGEKGKLTKMECIQMELGEPDASGRRRPVPKEGSEFIIEVDTVIPTIGQSPETSYLPKNSNVKLHPKWESFEVDDLTKETSVPGIFSGGDAVRGPDTIIWAVADGKEAAISIDRFIRGVDLKEGRGIKKEKVEDVTMPDGPKVQRVKPEQLPVDSRIKTFDEVTKVLTEEQVMKEAARCLDCSGCSECGECAKVCDKQAIIYDLEDEIVEKEVGAVVVATGYDLYPILNMKEYGSGEIKDVIDGLAFERLLSASGPTGGEVKRPSDGKEPKEVVFVQCSGSRDPEHHKAYCSKVCCMYSTKHAMLYKHRVHDGQPYIFYIDMRTGGKGYEEFYQRAAEEDKVIFLRGKVSKIFQDNGKVIVWGSDTLTGKEVEVQADLVVLAMAMEPSKGTKNLVQKLKIGCSNDDFIGEAHPKLRPVESISAGFFLAGCAQAPKDIPEAVAQASGAAAKVVALFSKDQLEHEPVIATVDEEICCGCRICIQVCPYDAREYDEEKNIAKVNAALCEGCGACVAACPSGATGQKNYEDNQIMEMIKVSLED